MMIKSRARDILILLGYVGLIYSTLPVAPKIFSVISKALGPNTAAFMNATILLIGLWLVYLFYTRPEGTPPAAWTGLLAILSLYGLLLARYTSIIAEKVHLLEYGYLSYLALKVFKDMRSREVSYICVIITVVVVGYLDELIQKILPNRVYDMRDVYLNVLSGLLGLALVRLLNPQVDNSSR